MKKKVLINVDEFIHKRAQDKMLNISALCEDSLRIAVEAKKKDVPEESLVLKCSRCDKIVDYGFYCRERKIFVCQDCQNNFDMEKCPHTLGEHEHIRVPGYLNQNNEYIKVISS